MKRVYAIFLLISALLSAPGALVSRAFAAACTSVTGTRDWEAASSWTGCGGGTPQPGDTVTIVANSHITLNSNAAIAGLTFEAGSSNSSLTHAGASALLVNGPAAIEQPTGNNRNHAWNVNAGSATVTGLLTFAGTTDTNRRTATLAITTGEFNAFGGITFVASNAASKEIVMSGGAGRLNLKGALTVPANSATLIAGTAGSVFSYADNANAQTIQFFSAGEYHNLHVNNASAGGATLGAAVTAANVTGNVRVESGTLKNGGFAINGNAGRTFEVADGATFEMTGASSFPAGFSTIALGAASRVRFAQTTNPLSVPSLSYGHLDLMPAGTATQRLPAGAVSVQGDLTIGNGANAATVDLDTNGSILSVGGNLAINANATLTADDANGMTVGGNWTRAGTFTHNAGTVAFNGSAAQAVNHGGAAFGHVVVQNGSNAGLTFSSGWSAAQLTIDTASLGSAATVYFAAGATASPASLRLAGTAGNPISLRSTAPGTYWLLNNAGAHAVSYVDVRDSNASGGNRIFNHPGGVDLGHNLNWAIGLNPPGGFALSSVAATSLSYGWAAASPAPDSYMFSVSPNIDFSAPVTSASTGLLSATTSSLLANTTYHARVAAVISGVASDWTAALSTVTLANPPAAAAAPFPNVAVTSMTAAWEPNGNPAGTRYVAELSDASDFSTVLRSTATTGATATFTGLMPATRYYVRARALSHANIATADTVLGDAPTLPVNPPTDLAIVAATENAVAGDWSAPAPPGDTYLFQVSDNESFVGLVITTETADTTAGTPATLAPNTTHYARVTAVIGGSAGLWSASVATATLALTPAAAAQPFPGVFITSVTAAWQANGNPAGTTYEVQLSTVAGFGSGQLVTAYAQAPSAAIPQLVSGATYYGRVRAINHSGIPTAYLALGDVTTELVPIPKDLAFTAATASSLTAAWEHSDPQGASYELRVSVTDDFSTAATSGTAGTVATISGLLANTTYFGSARAIFGGVPRPWSAYVTTATLANAPALAAQTWTVQVTSLTVAWAANGNPSPTRYVVDVSTHADFSAAVATRETTSLSAGFTNLVPGLAYHGRVRAVNHSGRETAALSLGSASTNLPAAPSGLAVTTATATSISAAWLDSVPPGDAFLLQIDDDPAFASVDASSATADLSATPAGALAVNTTYYARVRSVVNGGQSAWSASAATATLALVPAAAGTTWSGVDQSAATLSWAANGNPAGTLYVAELADTADFSSEIFSVQTTALSASYTNLLTDTPYWARVKAVNRSGIETGYYLPASTQTAAPNSCNAVATGNWSSAATWSNCTGPGGFPALTDAVIINSGRTVTLDVDATVAGLTFAAAGANNGLTHSGASSLTVNGPVRLNQPTSNNRTSSWNINAGAATVAGLITFAGTNTSTSRPSRVTITTGELNANGGIAFTASAAATKEIVMSGGAGRLNLKGNLTIPANSCTLTAGTAGSIFNYADATSAQTVRFFSSGGYHNLHINNTSAGGATLGAAITATNVSKDLRIQSGTLKTGGFAIAGGAGDALEVADGGTLEMTGTSAFPTGFSTITLGSASRVRYSQTTTPLSVSNRTYGHLDLTPAGTATQRLPAGGLSVQGDLTVGNGTNAATADLNTNGTALTVGGDVVVRANATLAADNTNGLTVQGDWTNAGAFTHNNGTVTFDGTGAQAVAAGAGAFANLVSANDTAGGLTFSESFSASQLTVNTGSLSSSATLYFSAGSTATIGALVVTGTAARPVVLRSTIDGSQWRLANTGSNAVSYALAKDSDARGGEIIRGGLTSNGLGNNLNWDFGPPAAVANLAATRGSLAGTLDLTWNAPGDGASLAPLMNAAFIIQYTADAAFAAGNGWSPTAALPAGVDRVNIATTNVSAGDPCQVSFSALSPGVTYYFRVWTLDEAANYSDISNGATNYATPLISSITLSTNVLSFGSLSPGTTAVYPVPVIVTNHGNAVVSFNVAITPLAVWQPASGPADIDTFRLTGIFQDDLPFEGDFSADTDVVTASTAAASAVRFARDGAPDSQKGINVYPNESRKMWFRMEMPPISSTVDQQTIRLHVSD